MNNSEIKDIISLIKDLDANTNFDVEIPSQQKAIKFKQLTTEQLKRLLKTIIDSPIYSTEFILTFNSIIKENCLDSEVDVNNFTIYDKLFILYKTRIESISQTYTFYFTDEEISQYNLKEKSKTISLADHFNDFIKEGINFNPVTYTHNDSVISCSLPTIGTENKLEKELHKNIKIDPKNLDQLLEIHLLMK